MTHTLLRRRGRCVKCLSARSHARPSAGGSPTSVLTFTIQINVPCHFRGNGNRNRPSSQKKTVEERETTVFLSEFQCRSRRVCGRLGRGERKDGGRRGGGGGGQSVHVRLQKDGSTCRRVKWRDPASYTDWRPGLSLRSRLPLISLGEEPE